MTKITGTQNYWLELAKLEAQIVRNYEILLTAIFGGIIALTAALSLREESNLFWFLLIGALGSTTISPLANGRSFHYAIYERARDESLAVINRGALTRSRNQVYDDRKSCLCCLSFGAIYLRYWLLWPVLAFTFPILVGLVKCLIGE